MRGGGWRMK
ncbi:hypothetical protein A2U01_0071854, partial [Trifolium medium]|nr:hypothetical protein [Trifolium medium]